VCGSLQLAGKLGRPGRLNAVVPGLLVHITDQITGRRFLVDTGAAVSIIPHTSTLPAGGQQLSGPSGSPIKCWGEANLQLRFSGRLFSWTFLQAAVAFPILGVDFLRAHSLLVDVTAGRLVDGVSGDFLALVSSPSGPTASVVVQGAARDAGLVPPLPGRSPPSPGASPPSPGSSPPSPGPSSPSVAFSTPPGSPPAQPVADSVQRILSDFSEVVNPSQVLPASSHGVEHFLQTTGPPIASPFRRLDAEKLAIAKAEFAELEKQGIVRRSSSPWASPLHMVEKADGSWRPCGDYRRLNGVTVPDTYPLPNMMDFSARVAGCRWFSKIDLRKGYHQIPMHPADVEKTAIITPFGLFEYTRMTFGMRNAGSTFQRMMDRVLAGLDVAFAYLDDILVGSPTLEEHFVHLRQVFQRILDAGLVINGGKCVFAVEELDFLGHHVTSSGIRPIASKVEALQHHPLPGTVKQLQAFLGVVNFYRRFVPAAAHLLRPLTDALKGGLKPAAPLTWTEEMKTAFEASKASLCKTVQLAHPSPAAELALMVDASADHVGAALHQRGAPTSPWQPLGFFSRKLSPAQIKYSAFDRELLACCEGIRHFRYMLEGRRFTIYTDHKPLTFALQKVADPWTARQSRHLGYVAEFTSDIRHVPGKENVVADLLSRPPSVVQPAVLSAVAASSAQVDFAALARAQETCTSTQKLFSSSSLQLQQHVLRGVPVLCDVSTGIVRPVVPEGHRRAIFDSVHGLAHPGVRATRRLLSARFVWRGMASDAAAWCRDCQHCARAKTTSQYTAPVQPIPVPATRFSHVHVDLVGPLPVSSEGYQYLFTIVDRTTRWLEAVPLRTMTADSCVAAFVGTWVSRFGVPATLTSDQGRQFTSAVWSQLSQHLGIKHVTTTAYHPQSNGMVERAHRQLKDALRARLAGNAWPDHLPYVLLGLRAAPKEDSGVSSAELVYGTALSLPAQFVGAQETPPEVAAERVRTAVAPPTRPSYAAVAASPPASLLTAEYVYVRRGGVLPPLSPAYSGPFRVVSRCPKFFSVQIGTRVEVITVDRLKPHVGAAPVQPAAPPLRGRPPASLHVLDSAH
jgi:transposase InsO family protein